MYKLLKNIWDGFEKKEKSRFSSLIALDVLINIIDILSLALLLWIIQGFVHPAAQHQIPLFTEWLKGHDPAIYLSIFILFFALKNWFAILISNAQYRFIGEAAIRITKNNLEDFQKGSYTAFVNVDSSAHIRNISFQPFDYCQYTIAGVQQIITQSSLVLITIMAIVIFNAKLFIILMLILLPPVVVVFYFIKKQLTIAKEAVQSSNEQSFRYLLDALKGYVESNIFNKTGFFMQRYIRARKKFSTQLFHSLALQGMPNRIIEIFAVLGLLILVLVARWTGKADSEMLLTIGAFLAAAYKIIPGVVKVINISGQMKSYLYSVPGQKLNDPVSGSLEPQVSPIHSIEAKHISFQYDNKKIIDDLSFTINKGDFIGISGNSGKGKTTLFNILSGFIPLTKGKLFFNHTAVEIKDIKKYWTSISYVRQQSFFIHDTILRNITLEEEDYDEAQLQQALRISGLEEIMSHFDAGIKMLISENGKNLSGGQQQRIAIARAIYKTSSLVLMDEPFNELDEEATRKLLPHFAELAAQGKIIIMITHDKESLAYCNKIISLNE